MTRFWFVDMTAIVFPYGLTVNHEPAVFLRSMVRARVWMAGVRPVMFVDADLH